MPKPVVALVGRPNVGKSTLFNRLAGQRLAVVDDRPGTTRDRLVAEAQWRGAAFDLVDTGGIDPTGGLRGEPLSLDSADYIEQIRSQAEMAVGGADAVLFLVDTMAGVTPADHEVAAILRRAQGGLRDRLPPPVLLVANRCDNPRLRAQAVEFYELGMGDPHPVSALHGIGTGDLLDELFTALGPQLLAPEEPEASVRIAIVGRPNVGKSSLLNRILGEERVIVSPIPGTTRDAIDTHLQAFGTQVTLVDTAGIRRRGHIDPGVEKYSVLRALRALERADVALLVTDATAGVTAQDAHIAGMVVDLMRSVVVIVNKWDAVDKDSATLAAYTAHVRQELSFLDYVPVLFISALTGQRVSQVLPTALQVQEERLRRIATSDLNRMLQEALEQHPPPAHAGQEVRMYFMAQVRTDPPTFAIQVSDPKRVHFTYTRYLENRMRERYGFLGTPVRIVYRKHERKPRR